MSLDTSIGILGLVAIAACWALSVVLYRVSTSGSIARMLCVLLVLEGFVERALLELLRDSLGITPSDAEALERELLAD